jgi:hypothetical protein
MDIEKEDTSEVMESCLKTTKNNSNSWRIVSSASVAGSSLILKDSVSATRCKIDILKISED